VTTSFRKVAGIGTRGSSWTDLQGFGNQDLGFLLLVGPQLCPDGGQPHVLISRVLQPALQDSKVSSANPGIVILWERGGGGGGAGDTREKEQLDALLGLMDCGVYSMVL